MARLTMGLAVVLIISLPLSAQGPTTYQLTSQQSWFSTGCQGPSQCACPVQFIGNVSGTFEMQELFPPLLPIRDFAINNVQWTVVNTTTPTNVTGSGTYHVDITSGQHQMDLNLSVNGGPTQLFTSSGYVAGGAAFETLLVIDIFAQLNACAYDGFSLQATAQALAPAPQFVRGECNADASFNLADVVFLLGHLFPPQLPAPQLTCDDACDANDDGSLNVADAVAMLGTLFPTGLPVDLPAPYPDCGVDPTVDALDCVQPGPTCATVLPQATLLEGITTNLLPQVTIVRDSATWLTLWAEHVGGSITPPPPPAVDFSQSMVVVVVRYFVSTGPDVEISQLVSTPTGIEVHFEVDPCFGLLPATSQPYHFVTAPTTPGATIPVDVAPCP
ncbi:MAG: hypothetical protein AAF581_02020 [Planctomycetota bacterium]